MLAERLERRPAPGSDVIDGGATPEDVTHLVRTANPDRVLMVDAAEMGLPRGSVQRIDPALIADTFLIDTHAIPLNFRVTSLKESVREVVFIGILPALVASFEDMTPAVTSAVEDLHARPVTGEDPTRLLPVA